MKPDIPALTGLRFFAAFAIVIHHVGSFTYEIRSGVLQQFVAHNGVLGMTLFFVLSGFIIHYNYYDVIRDKGKRGVYEFLVARFSRLYPLFITFFMLDVALILLKALIRGQSAVVNKTLVAVPAFVLGVQSWFYALIGNQTVTYSMENANITWSISTEFFLYLTYLAIGLLVGRRSSSRILGGYIVFFVLFHSALLLAVNTYLYASVEGVAIYLWGPLAGGTNSPSYQFVHWFSFLAPYLRFLSGCLIAQVFLVRREIPVSSGERILMTGVLLLSLLYIFCSWLPQFLQPQLFRSLYRVLEYRVVVPPLIYAIVRMPTIVSSFLSRPWLVRMGDASYSIYLLHILFAAKIRYWAPQDSSPTNLALMALHSLLLFAAIIGVSLFVFHRVELPAKKWLRQQLLSMQKS